MTGDTDDATLKVLRCTLPEGEVGSRRKEVGRLVAKATRNTNVADGVELEYPGDDATARALLDFVMFERHCCARLSFELRFMPDHGTTRLRITGAPDLVGAIRELTGTPN
jgi:hypothetical protein